MIETCPIGIFKIHRAQSIDLVEAWSSGKSELEAHHFLLAELVNARELNSELRPSRGPPFLSQQMGSSEDTMNDEAAAQRLGVTIVSAMRDRFLRYSTSIGETLRKESHLTQILAPSTDTKQRERKRITLDSSALKPKGQHVRDAAAQATNLDKEATKRSKSAWPDEAHQNVLRGTGWQR